MARIKNRSAGVEAPTDGGEQRCPRGHSQERKLVDARFAMGPGDVGIGRTGALPTTRRPQQLHPACRNKNPVTALRAPTSSMIRGLLSVAAWSARSVGRFGEGCSVVALRLRASARDAYEGACGIGLNWPFEMASGIAARRSRQQHFCSGKRMCEKQPRDVMIHQIAVPSSLQHDDRSY